ncbi:protein FAR1-RELATED SEQUENCE 5-like [Bidens hawaiensis]|uniref:protein FAR1-RELATED SEQUENCE 5-like n=1 Tax=Bidens hawaiensis TaxID=980011 RepID=UPI004049E78D
MYKLYADKAGFDTRLSTIKRHKGVITNRYILCNRAGIYRGKDIDTLIKKSPRSINYKVTDCQARVRLKVVKGTPSFQLYEFVESHNHGLVADENKDLTRSRRQLDFSDHEFIHKARLVSIGATRAYRIQSALKGGHHMVRGTKVEYTNSSRIVKAFIEDKDAQMVLNTMNGRMKNLHNYYFVYVAVKGELRSLFWADDVAKCNYSAFGDVLAFDATYKTNMYGMIFVPFTGVDHHKKCITFGAGLLHNETIKSYKWLLESFLEAHGIPEVVDDTKVYLIHHKDKRSGFVGRFKVSINLIDTTVSYSCIFYTRIGYLCRHMFSVFRMENIDKIPDHYISKHWDTYALPNSVYSIENRIGVDNNEKSRIRIEVVDDVQKCLDRLRDQNERLNAFATKIKELKKEIFEEFPHNPNHRNQKAMIEIASTISTLIGAREKVVEKAKKKKRLCSYCGKYANHDIRNCLKKKEEEAENQNETDDESSLEEHDGGSE